MICKNCGNKERFTMIKDIADWNAKEKKFIPITDGDEYYVCDDCTAKSGAGHIDTEGDY